MRENNISTISEAISDYDIEGFVNEEKKAEINTEESSTFQFEKIYLRTMEKIEQEKKVIPINEKQKERYWKSTAKQIYKLAGAIALFICIVTSGIVVASSQKSGFWKQFLGSDDKIIEHSLEKMEQVVGETKTIGAYKVTLKECLNDSNTAYVRLQINGPELKSEEYVQYTFARQRVMAEGGGSIGYFSDCIDEEKGDNQIDIIFSISHRDKITGKKIDLDLEDLAYYDENGELNVIQKGNWKFEFALENNVEVKTKRQLKKVDINGRKYWITKCSISPISCTINLVQDITNLWKPGYLNTSKLTDEIKIKLINGEFVEESSSGAGTKGYGISATIVFSKAINPEQIDMITLYGINVES